MDTITPELLLQAYAVGLFPMAEARDDSTLYWVEPKARGVLPLDGLHVPRRLRRTLRTGPYVVRIDTAFGSVIRACRESTTTRPESWINDEIVRLYEALHAMGRAHSVECWSGESLAGGLYGVSLGGAFFGESMFTRERDASKVALVHLVARLKRGGYRLLDCQFMTEHLRRFGTIEVSRERYRRLLAAALRIEGDFAVEVDRDYLDAFLQSTIQTS
ncbi:MAG: leucyl/phenylalanyl-tRNA--protein transferase [Alphaproteobacteria bacterium]